MVGGCGGGSETDVAADEVQSLQVGNVEEERIDGVVHCRNEVREE